MPERLNPANCFAIAGQVGQLVPQQSGGVAEWLNVPVLKTGVPSRESRVRISPPPLLCGILPARGFMPEADRGPSLAEKLF